jgi:hypothetical protein
VFLEILHNFILANFLLFRQIWRTRPKFQNNTLTSRGLSPLARVLTKGSVFDLLKVLMGECW